MGGNLFWGMQFCTCKNFWDSAGFSLAFIPKILTNTKATPPLLRLRFCESQNLGKNQAKIAESRLDSAPSQNLVNLNPCEAPKTKFLLLLAFAKSRVPLYLVIARKSVGFSWQSTKQ